DASDVVQQTLMEAWRGLDRLRARSERELAAWLRQILARQIFQALRDFQRDKRDVLREEALADCLDHSSACLGGWLADDASGPAAGAERRERAVQVAAALAELPEAQREAIELHYWEGQTVAEVAVHLGRSSAAVAGLLQRGLKALRHRLH